MNATAVRPISPSQVSLKKVWSGYHVWNIYTDRKAGAILRLSVTQEDGSKEWVVSTKDDLAAEPVEVAKVGSLAQAKAVGAWLYNQATGAEQGTLEQALAAAAPARRKAAASLSPEEAGVKVGDFFYTSWGYDQTNVEFYEVVALGAKSVKVRQVAQSLESDNGYGSERVTPVAGRYVGEVETKMLRPAGRTKEGVVKASISFESYRSGWLWDGTPKHQTAAGWGH